MKCYYEQLGVERDASEQEIKSAYRKLALRWHPDKNPDCMEEAKERFQLIQQAYEVLSDPQERAWYDNHREEILRGKDSNYEDNSLDVFAYFNTSCFKGFGDDAKGFYTVFRDVFQQIATEDIEFYPDPEEVEAIPKFGNSKSSYDEVVAPFYAFWQSYCTKKSYAWLNPYNVKEYRDRRILREIEKETKKIIQKAKKERNEEVRNLVAFVRKRDPRVLKNKRLLEERAALNRQKQEQNRLDQFRRRQQEVEEMKKSHKESVPDGYEEKLRQLAQQYGSGEEDSSEADEDDEDSEDVEEEEYVDELYCVACNKSFKNSNAFANHESSKKHKENIERLRSEMMEEEELYGDDIEGEESDEEEEDVDELFCVACNKSYKTAKAFANHESSKKHTDNVQRLRSDGTEDDENDSVKVEEATDAVDELIDEVNASLVIGENDDKGEEGKDSKVESEKNTGSSDEVIDVSHQSTKSSKKKNKNKKKAGLKTEKPTSKEAKTDHDSDNDWDESSANKKGPRKSKKTQKQAKGKSKPSKNPADSPESSDESEAEFPRAPVRPAANTTSDTLACAKCGAVFSSKNKLFAHLKETQHSMYLPKHEVADGGANKQKKPKGKKKK